MYSHFSCDIEFKSTAHVTVESISVLFIPRRMDLDDKYGVGFLRIPDKPGQWRFEGTGDVLLESRILKRSFTHEKDGAEELLVGHQLLRGYISKGGPIDLPGIRILRLTPQFAISVELDFDGPYYDQTANGYKQLREAVSQELVDIVKSVQPTPGQAGPTVRPSAQPPSTAQVLCFTSGSSSRPIRLQLTLPRDGTVTGSVRYERGSADIPLMRANEETVSPPSQAPAVVKTTFAELINGQRAGRYVLTTQGAVASDLVYSRPKDNQTVSFHPDPETTSDDACAWGQKRAIGEAR